MLRTRVIPVLLLRGSGLYKTEKFRNPKYVGDPLNVIKIFNEKEVDEIVLLDIMATKEGRGPNFALIADMASECFMPLAYGGGITSIEEIKELFYLGVEKIVLNTSAVMNPILIQEATKRFGSQSVVVSIDYKNTLMRGNRVHIRSGTSVTKLTPTEHVLKVAGLGAGEIILNSISRDGTFRGYDIPFLKSVAEIVDIPVVALGGAREIDDFRQAVSKAGVDAVAVGSMFVFQGPHRAVLINVPERKIIEDLLGSVGVHGDG